MCVCVCVCVCAVYGCRWVPWSPGSAAGTADLHPLSPQLLQAGLLVCCGLSLLVLIFWPSDGLMRGPVLGEPLASSLCDYCTHIPIMQG